MATTIITTDKMTAVRAAAISQITGNDTIGISKALLIEEAKRQMLNGICHFIFRRKDGSLTERYGTLIPSLCSKHVKGTGTSPEQRGCMIFWDCSIGAFRSCRWENIVTIL
jgi:hypothetical protein